MADLAAERIMPPYTFLVRAMSADGGMLGSRVIQGVTRGDGAIWPDGAFQIPIESPGIVSSLSIQWVDVNLAVPAPGLWQPIVVSAGDTLTVGGWNQLVLLDERDRQRGGL